MWKSANLAFSIVQYLMFKYRLIWRKSVRICFRLLHGQMQVPSWEYASAGRHLQGRKLLFNSLRTGVMCTLLIQTTKLLVPKNRQQQFGVWKILYLFQPCPSCCTAGIAYKSMATLSKEIKHTTCTKRKESLF